MGHFTNKVQKIAVFCLPLSWYLTPFATELDRPSEDKYHYMDDDDYEIDYFMKYNIFLNHVDKFFRENPGLYNEDLLKEEIYNLFR